MLLGNLERGTGIAFRPPTRNGLPVDFEPVIVDDASSLDHAILVGLQGLFVQREKYMYCVFVAIERLFMDADLEEFSPPRMRDI